jgi:hypothetical protein
MSQDCLLFFDMVLFGVFFFWLRLTRYALRCKYDSNKAPMTTTDDTDTCRRPARGPLVRRRRRHLVQTGRPGEGTDRRPDATTDQSERLISQGLQCVAHSIWIHSERSDSPGLWPNGVLYLLSATFTGQHL